MVFLPGDELLSRADFQKIFDHIDAKLAHLSGWERWTSGMWQTLVESFNLLNHVLWPILLGTVIVGLLVALALYTGIRRTVEAIQRRRAARLAHWFSRREQAQTAKERKKTNADK
jgi:hypothetical protein